MPKTTASNLTESEINYALFAMDSNHLGRLRRYAHELTPQNTKDLLEALNNHANESETKDCQIEELQNTIDSFVEIAESIEERAEELEALKADIEELKKSTKTSTEIVETVNELLDETLETLKEDIKQLKETAEDYK